MVLQILFPAKMQKLITDQFGIITTTLGRGIIMLIFSLLFLGFEHLFHKLVAIFLFIGGFIITFLELAAPSLKGGENKFYPHVGKDGRNNQNDSLPPTTIDDSQPQPEVLDNTPNEHKLPSLEEKTKDNQDFQF